MPQQPDIARLPDAHSLLACPLTRKRCLRAVIYLLFPQPIFRGASCLEHFTPASFHSMVLQDPQPADVAWLVRCFSYLVLLSTQLAQQMWQALLLLIAVPVLAVPVLPMLSVCLCSSAHAKPAAASQVEFYAPWAPPCIHLEPVFAELSLTYTNDKLRFGKVDASR